MNKTIQDYRTHFEKLDYPEYAHTPTGNSLDILDLSLWGNGVHPDVAQAAISSLGLLNRYQEAQDPELVARIAGMFEYPKASISVVAGADDALRIVSQYCICPGSKVLIPVPSFGRYEYHAYINQADIHFVEFTEYPYEIDLQKVADYANEHDIDVIFLATPNSPTGSLLPPQGVENLLKAVSASIILDESLLVNTKDSVSAELLDAYPNLFVCGSFSKLYDLAGLRVGYLVAHESHQRGLRALISPFEVNTLAVALAKYTLSSEKLIAEKVGQVQGAIKLLRDFKHPKLRISNTVSTVALLEYAGDQSLHKLLQEHGILTVSGENFRGLEHTNTVRIIIRHKRDIARLLTTMQQIL